MMRGITKAARIAKMATTTMISMNVKPAAPPQARGARHEARTPRCRCFLLHIVHMPSTCSLPLIEHLPLYSSHHASPITASSRLRENHLGTQKHQKCARVVQQRNIPAGGSKRSSSKAAASEGPRRYRPHFVWAVRPCNGSWRTEKRLQCFCYPRIFWYVEGLNDAR